MCFHSNSCKYNECDCDNRNIGEGNEQEEHTHHHKHKKETILNEEDLLHARLDWRIRGFQMTTLVSGVHELQVESNGSCKEIHDLTIPDVHSVYSGIALRLKPIETTMNPTNLNAIFREC